MCCYVLLLVLLNVLFLVTLKKQLGTILEKYVSYKDGICFIFLALFLPLIGHVARYTPSSSEKNISKI